MATQTRNPTSDEAASGTLSGSAGTRYTLVDDHPDTGGADVLTFGTTTAQITFGYAAFSIPQGSTSISVQVLYYDGEAANGANNCGGRLKVGTQYFNAATHNPSGTTYTSRSDNFATNPATSAAWTVDQVNGVGANALQAFGIGSTDSNPTFRVSSVQLQVTYTAPAARTAAIATSAGAQTSALAGGVTVAGDVVTSASSQQSAMTGAVESSGRTADVATQATAQQSAMTGTVTVGGVMATSAGSQTSAMGSVAIVSAGIASAAASQVAAMTGNVTIGADVATTAGPQASAMSGSVVVTGDIATQASAQQSAMAGSTTGAEARTADITTVAGVQSSAMSATVVVTGSIATGATSQTSAMTGSVAAVVVVPEPRRRRHAAGDMFGLRITRTRSGFARWRRVR